MAEEETKNDDTQDDTTKLDETGEEDTEKEHEPAEGSKRWKEIYHEAKEAGRKVTEIEQKLTQRDQDFEALRTQNDALQTAIDNVGSKISKNNRPNPEEDPEGYDNYLIEEVQRRQRAAAPPRKTTAPSVNPQQQAMENAMAAAKSDYYEVINTVKADFERDRVLYNQIWGSPNPYQAAYKYGTDKANRAKQGREDSAEQGYVEGETIHTDTEKKTLSAAEKKTAAGLGISEKNYLKQREFIENNPREV